MNLISVQKQEIYDFSLSFGGDCAFIYRFDPFGGWSEWLDGDISPVQKKLFVIVMTLHLPTKPNMHG